MQRPFYKNIPKIYCKGCLPAQLTLQYTTVQKYLYIVFALLCVACAICAILYHYSLQYFKHTFATLCKAMIWYTAYIIHRTVLFLPIFLQSKSHVYIHTDKYNVRKADTRYAHPYTYPTCTHTAVRTVTMIYCSVLWLLLSAIKEQYYTCTRIMLLYAPRKVHVSSVLLFNVAVWWCLWQRAHTFIAKWYIESSPNNTTREAKRNQHVRIEFVLPLSLASFYNFFATFNLTAPNALCNKLSKTIIARANPI